VPDELLEAIRAAAVLPLSRRERSQRITDLVRAATGRRWVGVYEVTLPEVVNLAWSGPAPPAYPRFPVERGLTGEAIRACSTIVSNDVASDPRYLTALASTGSELIVPVVEVSACWELSISRTSARTRSGTTIGACSSASPPR
jgi:putative methionine-R-sulfoxide reductase with GAF domain